MASETIRRGLLAGLLLAVAGCKKEAPKPAEDDSGNPQVTTSMDDVDLPVDRSDEISAIDATTGDAHGMPRDGGSVIRTPKTERRPAVEAPAAENGSEAIPTAPTPLVTPPPVAAPAPPPPGN